MYGRPVPAGLIISLVGRHTVGTNLMFDGMIFGGLYRGLLRVLFYIHLIFSFQKIFYVHITGIGNDNIDYMQGQNSRGKPS